MFIATPALLGTLRFYTLIHILPGHETYTKVMQRSLWYIYNRVMSLSVTALVLLHLISQFCGNNNNNNNNHKFSPIVIAVSTYHKWLTEEYVKIFRIDV